MLNRRKQGIGHCITHCMHLILKQYRPTFRTGICAWYTNVHHRYNAGDLHDDANHCSIGSLQSETRYPIKGR